MCSTCGCSGADEGTRIHLLTAEHEHPEDDAGHGHGHGHEHEHGHEHGHDHRTVALEQQILAKNDSLAALNRRRLADRGIAAVNLMSSPGSGKTTLLEATVRAQAGRRETLVVEGDQETWLDARRIRSTGSRVVQINTGAGCHLDASMLAGGLDELDPPAGSLVFVENVGNLVCPALFDLGETARAVIISVTEGADKPAKYPYMFREADLVLLNKIDLLPYVDFDVDLCLDLIHRLNPKAGLLHVSATKGTGLDAWYDWLDTLQPVNRSAAAAPR